MLAIASAFTFSLMACDSLEKPDTDMRVAIWTISDAKYDHAAQSVTRARVHLLVSGFHEQPYTFTYTIDGQPGTGSSALHRLAKGEEGAELLTEEFDGNCPSGTPLEIPCYRVNNHTMQYHGGTDFLMPLLAPGVHTFTATISNEFGQTLESTKTFTVDGPGN